jgi:hypothetical protein
MAQVVVAVQAMLVEMETLLPLVMAVLAQQCLPL